MADERLSGPERACDRVLRQIREFRLKSGGIFVGEPLREFRGILTGVPVYDSSDHQSGAGVKRDSS